MPRTSACHAGFVNYCGFDGDGDLPPRKDTHLWADEEMALQSATQTQLATPNIMYPAYNPMQHHVSSLQPHAPETAAPCIRGCNLTHPTCNHVHPRLQPHAIQVGALLKTNPEDPDGPWRWSCVCGVQHRHVRGTTKGDERDLACAYPTQVSTWTWHMHGIHLAFAWIAPAPRRHALCMYHACTAHAPYTYQPGACQPLV